MQAIVSASLSFRQTFFEGYKELWEDNFFGVSEEELPYIPFIDRINLYFKGNSLVEFSDEEMPYVVRAGQTKTFREVVDLAVEIYEFSKQKQEEKDEDFNGRLSRRSIICSLNFLSGQVPLART